MCFVFCKVSLIFWLFLIKLEVNKWANKPKSLIETILVIAFADEDAALEHKPFPDPDEDPAESPAVYVHWLLVYVLDNDVYSVIAEQLVKLVQPP